MFRFFCFGRLNGSELPGHFYCWIAIETEIFNYINKDFAKIPENAESKAVDREKEEYPVQQVAVTYPIGEKEVKDAVKELNPDTDSLGSRG